MPPRGDSGGRRDVEVGTLFIHATGRRGVAKDDAVRHDIRAMSPADRLSRILEEGCLLPFNTYYSGGDPVVCLSEADEAYFAELVTAKGHDPWAMLLDPARLPHGVEPVRYHHRDDDSQEAGWRTVHYQWGHVNWMWEREWRWRGPEALDIRAAVTGVLIDDPDWPPFETAVGPAPDGSAEAHPVVPTWADGLERFLWDRDEQRFKRIGPRVVPPYEYVEAGVERGRRIGRSGSAFGMKHRKLVWLDEQDPAEVRRELLKDAKETLSDWLADQCPGENCDWGEVTWVDTQGPWETFEHGRCQVCGSITVRCGNCGESHAFVNDQLECHCRAKYEIEYDGDRVEEGVVQVEPGIS